MENDPSAPPTVYLLGDDEIGGKRQLREFCAEFTVPSPNGNPQLLKIWYNFAVPANWDNDFFETAALKAVEDMLIQNSN